MENEKIFNSTFEDARYEWKQKIHLKYVFDEIVGTFSLCDD
jgi:hypothetical protein